MGSHIGTAGLVGFATAALVVMALFILVADDRLRNISGFSTNNDLTNAHSQLVTAQILAWISAGLALLLMIGYFVLHWIEFENEWIHLILWIGIFGTLIASIILIAIALGSIDRANITDDNDAGGFSWTALGIGIGAFVFLLISGGWRVGVKLSEPKKGKIYRSVPTGNAEIPNKSKVKVVSGGGATTEISHNGNGYETATSSAGLTV